MSYESTSTPLVSVVTPAYNEEPLISECVESVLKQTYRNWEYIIVDNCSSDRTSEIVSRYARQDSRIRVITNKQVLPAVVNFNSALRHISPGSKYTKIVFADDWMFPECVERMVSLATANSAVGIVGAYGLEGQWVLWEGLPYGRNVIPGREICRERLLGGPYIFGAATSLLYRSDLIRENDPFFNEANPHAADSEVCFKLLKQCDFGFIHQVLTFSRKRPGSMVQESVRLNSWAADILRELVTFGKDYLTDDEYSRQLRITLRKYEEFLASRVLKGETKDFWEFHRRGFRVGGRELNMMKIRWAFLKRIPGPLIRLLKRDEKKWGL